RRGGAAPCSPASPANGAAGASLAAGAPRYEQSCSWGLSWPRDTILSCAPSSIGSSRPGSRRWSLSSQSLESCSPSSTPSCETKGHGKPLDEQDSRSPLVGEGYSDFQ